MNTPVNFKLAKFLKEKGFVMYDGAFYDEIWGKDKLPNLHCIQYYIFHKHRKGVVAAPTIAEVIMWLYETYGIWIWCDCSSTKKWIWSINLISKDTYIQNDDLGIEQDYFNSPKEAYEAAIEYTLKNLI